MQNPLGALRAVLLLVGLFLPACGDTTNSGTLRADGLVSLNRLGMPSNGAASAVSLSADGAVAAFQSDGDDLADGDLNGLDDIFITHIGNGVTTRITAGANGASSLPVLSADGRYVVYRSFADNLAADDLNLAEDLFLTEIQSGVTLAINRHRNGSQGAAGWLGGRPAIDKHGDTVAFCSAQPGLVDNDLNLLADLFIYTRIDGNLAQVGGAVDGGPANGPCGEHVSLSDDGEWLAFSSGANNLISADLNGRRDVFVQHLTDGVISRVSETGGLGGDGDSSAPVISADGRFVLFTTLAENLDAADGNGAPDYYLHDRETATTELLGLPGADAKTSLFAPAYSVDRSGRYVALSVRQPSASVGAVQVDQVFVLDRITGIYHLMSQSAFGEPGLVASHRPHLTPDGATVAFASRASNLTTDGVLPNKGIFVKTAPGGLP